MALIIAPAKMKEEAIPAFAAVLDTAAALQAPTIRVWAGCRGSAVADDDYRRRVRDDLLRIAEMAQPQGISVSLEYHGNTLTDTDDSAIRLLEVCQHSAIFTYWQPPLGQDLAANLAALGYLGKRLSNLHVFHWHLADNGKGERLALAAGEEIWRKRLAAVLPGRRWALLEFFRGDSLAQMREDAVVLKRMLGVLAAHQPRRLPPSASATARLGE